MIGFFYSILLTYLLLMFFPLEVEEPDYVVVKEAYAPAPLPKIQHLESNSPALTAFSLSNRRIL